MNSRGIIFIPDISGFSKFVSEMEIIHGNEITAELLEEIINSDELDFEISEIEGDAVFFYKMDSKITFEGIVNQSLKTLKNFRERLESIQSKRFCKCNACSSAANLSLKFVLHEDDLQIMQIKSFKKLYGKGVILAHRLLKNNVEGSEYLIFTKSYFEKYKNEFSNLDDLKKIFCDLEGFGKVECYYLKLD